MGNCPKCGSSTTKVLRRWELRSPKSRRVVRMGLYKCEKCGKTFRSKS